MGPELVFGRLGISTDASESKETAGIMDEQKNRHTRCTSNCQDNTFEMEVAGNKEDGRSQDVEVGILHCTNPADVGLLEPPCQDLTESSSSFADSLCGDEDAMRLSEGEVQSEFHCDAPSVLPSDEYSEIFRIRKKRLTPHWTTFIRPIEWRCKWLELQIKRCQDEATKYEREIAAYNKKKQSEAEKYTSEGFCAKSHPFSSQVREVMMRKKRKRFEETADIASYMGRHNLFSYYERSAHNASLLTGNLGNREKPVVGNGRTEVDDELLSHEFRDNQNSMELILGKIEKVHSRLSTMKTRLNKTRSGHALASVARYPATPCDSGERKFLESSCAASQHISKDSLGHVVISGSVASLGHEKMGPAGVVNSRDNTKVASPVHIADGMLMYRRRTKQEVDDGIEGSPVQPTERSLVVKAEQHSSFAPSSLPGEADFAGGDQPAPKIRSLSNLAVTNNRRKGGRGRSVSARSKA